MEGGKDRSLRSNSPLIQLPPDRSRTGEFLAEHRYSPAVFAPGTIDESLSKDQGGNKLV